MPKCPPNHYENFFKFTNVYAGDMGLKKRTKYVRSDWR